MLQKDVALLIGVDACSIFNWEGHYSDPSFRFYPKIIEFLGYHPIPEPDSVQEKIEWFRQSLGWSKREVAQEIGIDESTFSKWIAQPKLKRRAIDRFKKWISRVKNGEIH